MILIVTLINVFFLFIAIYILVKKIIPDDGKSLLLLTSAVISLIIISFLYYLMLILNQDFKIVLIFLSIINILCFYVTKNMMREIFKSKPSSLVSINVFWALGTVFFLTCYFFLYESKYGGWDAWAIWNLHAKFLYNSKLWTHLFTNSIAFSHPDYPLMVPSIVAFFWNGVNGITPIVPMLLSYGILLTIPLVIYFSLADKEGLNIVAIIALIIFIADSNYKFIACSQEADSLLSLFILLVFINYQRIKNNSDNRIYVLGFICASCAWIKNEGIVFYLLFTIGFCLLNYKHLSILKRYFIGLIVPTLVIISFKLFYSPANDLVAANYNKGASIIKILSDMSRYLVILKFAFNILITNYNAGLFLMFVVFVFNRKFFVSFPFLIISLLLIVYFIVYLFTPYDLNWHLSTSLYRLFQHIYPALIYLLLLSFRKIKENYELLHLQ